jgi:PGF-pre-PGF domain-containing protein
MRDKGNIMEAVLLAAAVIAMLASPVMAEETEVARSFSTTSPGPDSEFTVTLSISDIQVGFIDETIPHGFAFTEHPSDHQYYEVSGQRIAFAVVDDITEIRYKVVAPSSGGGTFSGVWEDFLNETNGTVTSTSISVVQPDDGGDDNNNNNGGGGGGFALPTAAPTKASEIINIEAGKSGSAMFEGLNVCKISIEADKNVSGVKVVVEVVDAPTETPEAPGIVYNYIDITATKLADVNITATIEFEVNKSWITDSNIDEATIKLNRYVGEWKTLPTSKLSEDDVSSHFEAETQGFSSFAISGEEKVEASPVLTPESEEASEPEEMGTSAPEEAETPEHEKGAPAPISTPHKDTDIGLIMIVAAIIALIGGIIAFAVFRSRRK